MEENELLKAIQTGDERAFEHLFKTYYPRLRGYASRFVDDEEEVRDLLQESFMHFWEKRDLLKATSVSSLLFVIVRNACFNLIKHKKLADWQSLDNLEDLSATEDLYCWDFGAAPEHKLLHEELRHQIEEVLSRLPVRCRQVFIMSRFQQLKNKEIAEKLQISTTAVEKHIAKALKAFSSRFCEKDTFYIYLYILAGLPELF